MQRDMRRKNEEMEKVIDDTSDTLGKCDYEPDRERGEKKPRTK